MSKKFLDYDGLLYVWNKIKAGFVAKETGKGLSTNDYTTTEKNKLSGIAAGATKNTVENVLTSTSTTNALSAAQGKALNDKISAINTTLEDKGAGDMLKSVYDTNNNGKVDGADDADKLGGQLPAYYAKATDIPTVTNDFTDAYKNKLDGIAEGANKITVDTALSSSSTNPVQNKAVNTALGNKVDKVSGKGLSTNDYTNDEKSKVSTAYTHSQAAHAPSNAEANLINTILVNGNAQTISAKAVDITVPTKVSDLSNDSEYTTVSQVANEIETNLTNLSDIFDGKLNNKANKATTLNGYGIGDAYTKTQTDTAIANAIANAGHLKRSIVTSLPAVSSADANTIYMVKDTSVTSGDAYKEYMLIDGAMVQIGDTTVDLSDYMKTADMEAISNSEIDTIVAA